MFEDAQDIAGFFSDFAIDVTLFPGMGNQKTIPGIFDAESIGITLAGGLEVTESQPQLHRGRFKARWHGHHHYST